MRRPVTRTFVLFPLVTASALWLVQPQRVELVSCWFDQAPIDRAARLSLLLDDVPGPVTLAFV